jgi:glutamine synthetase
MAENMRGLLDLDALEQAIIDDSIDTVIVAFTDHYGRLHGKRFDAAFFLEDTVASGTHGCDYLLTVDMEMNPVDGYRFANWELGYGDFHLVPDLTTLRLASWLEGTAIVLCDVHADSDHTLVPVAPRSILRHQLARLGALGFTAKGASELEYFMYEESYREAADLGFHGLSSIAWYSEDYHLLQGGREEFYNRAVRRHLRDSGIPVESSKGEFGRGQHELNIQYADLLEMADRHTIMKLLMKDVADQLGISVTFMAKPETEQAGSSCHLHLSLWEGTAGAFAGDIEIGRIRCSDTFRHFLGGWIDHVQDVMPFYGPTVNSYKRYQVASWAPTNIAWSYDNRTAGFRVVGSGPSLRIECRIPGADVNPYLAFAAALASGIDGIEHEIDPPEMLTGDGYALRDIDHVPTSLRQAVARYSESGFARAAFGDAAFEHYAHFYEMEAADYERAVTDWERVRYFDRI